MSALAQRLGRVREAVADPSVARRRWWLFSRGSDVRWLTGFDGSYGSVLVDCDGGDAVLLTDGRYAERAARLISSASVRCSVRVLDSARNLAAAIAELVGPDGALIVDPGQVTHSQFCAFSTAGHVVETAVSPLGSLRRRKDPEEIEAIRRAAAVTDSVLRDVVEDGLEGRNERSIAARIEYLMGERGADGPAFDTIVACGTNASVPHHVAGHDQVSPNDLVIIDVGALVDGYRSDMTRTVVVGSPDAERMELLRLVTEAQARGVAVVGPGVDCASVDASCRGHFESRGVAEMFIHGVGHGVGLDIHEEPFLTAAAGTALLEGEVVTVEPGLYREGLGGARVEDSVLVTPTGAEILTTTPKDIRCPPSRPMI